MTENINSEALDRLFEIDGQLYGAPSLVRMARIRASILHASAAWGSDADGVLMDQLADRVEQLWESLRWALAELNGKTRYDNDQQLEECFALAEAALASVKSDQDASWQPDKSSQIATLQAENAKLRARLELTGDFADGPDGIECRDETIRVKTGE